MSEREKERSGITLKCSFKSICIFGETDLGKDKEFIPTANELGRALAARKINFIYGGGIQGLRGSVAIAATMNGSKGLNVRVKELENHFFSLGKELRVSSLPERMGCMFYHADAFIALPGGFETLDGISSIVYWAKLNFHKKPLGLLNVNGFYDNLLSFFDHAVETGFIPQATHHSIIFAPTADQLLDKLQTYEPQPDLLVKEKGGQSSNRSQKKNPDTTLRL